MLNFDPAALAELLGEEPLKVSALPYGPAYGVSGSGTGRTTLRAFFQSLGILPPVRHPPFLNVDPGCP